MNMDKKIRKAFENATPDVLGSVLSDCQLEKGTVIEMKEKRKNRKLLEYSAAAAAVVLLFGLGAGIAGLVGSRVSNIPGSTQSTGDIPTEAKKWISQEDALRIAEEYTLNLYTDPKGKPLSTALLDKESSVYKVQVLYDTYDHEYEIDATTGEILNSQKELIELTVEDGYIGKVAARDIAMKESNTNLEYTTFLTIDAMLQDKILVYRVQFYCSMHCNYYINAITGEAVKGYTIPSNSGLLDLNDRFFESTINWNDARNIALKDADIPLSQITELEFTELPYKETYYSITFSSEKHNYEYKINSITSKVLESKKNGQVIYVDDSPTDGKLPVDYVISIALKQFYGLSQDNVTNIVCELQRESENAYYRITFTRRTYNYEIHIDAYTGEVLKSGWVIDLEGASLEDLLWTPGTWYNMALTCEYATPADIDLYCFFYRGFDDESSELTEAERAFMDSVSSPNWIYWSVDRLPTEKMDAVLQEYFGITLNETNKVKLHWFDYWEETNCYYHTHTDTLAAQIEIERVENQPDGTICVYYHRDYPEGNMVVTVRPNGDGYRILSNLPVAE